ncbi:MAG: hypothetical protein IPL35_02400 [Sphingobacteriales bacterium]|nr:hypothetical protein [Sphingobacteriales bacterium]
MKRQLSSVLCLFAMACMLLSNIGIAVNTHRCFSEDLFEVSLLPITPCAEREAESHPVIFEKSCCNKAASACKNKPISVSHQAAEKKNCCSYGEKYIANKHHLLISAIQFWSACCVDISLFSVQLSKYLFADLCAFNTHCIALYLPYLKSPPVAFAEFFVLFEQFLC